MGLLLLLLISPDYELHFILLLSMSQFLIPLLFQQSFEIKALKSVDFPVFSNTVSVFPHIAYLVIDL